MKTLRVSDTFAPPVEWLQLSTVVYGASGSGKSAFGRTLAEEAHHAGMRVCVIDVKGDYYGLKSSADGKSEGLPVIVFGGDHADVPLDINAGAVFGETIAHLGQSCILDLEHFPKDKRLRFLADFFGALYHHNREPLLVLMDEAQDYAPQTPRGQLGKDAARCLSAVEDLTKMGRKHGIGRVFFTQRGSGLNKEVSEICDVLVAFRTPGTLDQDRVKAWLGSSASKGQLHEAMAQIDGLPTGTALFASSHPTVRHFGVHAVRLPVTFDSSATPSLGRRKQEPTRLATPALDELRARLATTIERVQAEDPKALRARIADLERELVKARNYLPPPKVEEVRVEVPCTDPAVASAIKDAISALEDAAAGLSATNAGLKGVGDALRAAWQHAGKRPSLPTSPHPQAAMSPKPARPVGNHEPPLIPKAPRASGNLTLDRRILTVLAQYRGKGMTRDRLALHLGMHPNTKSLVNMLGSMRSSGWVDGFEPTADGLEALGSYEPLPAGDALLEMWCREKLAPAEERVLRAISGSENWTREGLAQHLEVHPNTKSFVNTLGKLRGLGLVEGLRLSPELVG